MEKPIEKKPTTRISLQELPPHAREVLKELDKDGDGDIDLHELVNGTHSFQLRELESLRKHHFFRKLFIILFCLWLTQLGCTFGVVFGVVLYAKDSAKLTAQDPVRGLPAPRHSGKGACSHRAGAQGLRWEAAGGA